MMSSETKLSDNELRDLCIRYAEAFLIGIDGEYTRMEIHSIIEIILPLPDDEVENILHNTIEKALDIKSYDDYFVMRTMYDNMNTDEKERYAKWLGNEIFTEFKKRLSNHG